MNVLSQSNELNELLKQFYILSGIKMVIFDDKYNEIMAYPNSDNNNFCSVMRQNKSFCEKCIECDRISFDKCRKTDKVYIHNCHAGLIEATAPIINDGKILGYAMFGQITNVKSKDVFTRQMIDICKSYNEPSEELLEMIKKIKYRTEKQIYAASKILDTCTKYILFKDMMSSPNQLIIEKIEKYIHEHLSERISVQRLCNAFFISKTQLYELVGKEFSGGIAHFIKSKKLSYAKNLLKETDMPIHEISIAIGFCDYNYFIRSFREKYNITPKKYRIKNKDK